MFSGKELKNVIYEYYKLKNIKLILINSENVLFQLI